MLPLPSFSFRLIRAVLLTILSARTRSSTSAANIETREVRREVRFFIDQYNQGYRKTTELIISDGRETREHMSSQSKHVTQAVARIDQKVTRVDQKVDHLVVREKAQMDEQARERFLDSLRYPEMNHRRQQVSSAYSKCLSWVFLGDNNDEDSNVQNSGNEDEPDFSQIAWDSLANWLRSTDRIYWITGKPGSGKTTLVKYILAHQKTRKCLDIWSPGYTIISQLLLATGFSDGEKFGRTLLFPAAPASEY